MTELNHTVADLGEDELLARILPLMPEGERIIDNGDDAAVLPSRDGRVVACMDVVVEDRHFRREYSTGADVGWRVAMQNLSDISAMGARGTQLLIGLVVPGQCPASWVIDFARGVGDACAHATRIWGSEVGVAGGDLSSGDHIVVCVTALGALAGQAPLTRAGARPGDTIAVCGTLGYSAAGLALARAGMISDRLPPGFAPLPESGAKACDWARYAWHVYRRPQPVLGAGVSAADAGASAAMDVSDGLLRDLGRLARASGVDIDLGVVSEDAGLLALATLITSDADAARTRAAQWWLTGGEDHGLVAAFPHNADLPPGFVPIGRAMSGDGTVHVRGRGADLGVGWDHFAPTGRDS